MLDQFRADSVQPASGGIAVDVGAYRFLFACSGRDRDHLSQAALPAQVYCQVEFDLQTGTIHALAFSDEERRDLYRALREISGIGRASAFAVLDAGELLDTLRAVAGDDIPYFKAVPGLGPKKITAVLKALSRRYGGRLPQPVDVSVALLVEARDALLLEGLSAAAAERLLLAALGSGVKSAEEWVARASASE
jgi:Holliday junction resolvasome RuvABC DNA-binding subunit